MLEKKSLQRNIIQCTTGISFKSDIFDANAKQNEIDCQSTFASYLCISFIVENIQFRYVDDISRPLLTEAVAQRFSVKKVFIKISQNPQENNCARVSFLIKLQARGLIKKEDLAQLFSCEFCEISKNTLFYRKPFLSL